jgi:hypothetical protein
LLAAWSFPIGFIPFVAWSLFGNVRRPLDSSQPKTESQSTKAKKPGFFSAAWRAYWKKVAHVRRSLALRRLFGYLFTNACGDFTLMARAQWEALRGYQEFPGFPMNVDGLLLYAAKTIGMKEETCNASACVFHIEHDDGSGYSEYESGEKWRQLESRKIPYIDMEELIQSALDMGVGKKLAQQNDGNWGAPDQQLPETRP